jgi:hypothetical protein
VTALLTDIGTGALALSHEALDQVPASRAAEHLREMLVHHGLLPAGDPDLAKFERWLQARLDSIEPAAVRQPLERFATWHHLRRIRARSRQGEAVHGAVHCAKQEITETGRLLAWLHQQGLTLAECTQGRLEEWLTSGPSTRTAARTFINWARSNRSAGDIEIPARTARSTPLITHEARLDLLRRCLVEEPDTLTYRVATALLLLYAQPMSRVAAMRIEQINVTGERLTFVLGNEPAEVPPPFADLLLDLVANRPNLQTGNAGTSPWLFPSTRARPTPAPEHHHHQAPRDGHRTPGRPQRSAARAGPASPAADRRQPARLQPPHRPPPRRPRGPADKRLRQPHRQAIVSRARGHDPRT